ncbi:MAG: hypothetical protein PVI33_05510 [Candidatus Omnitrophota bacterium]|jgi:uncharacterized repeat protein (TIGR04076 family)
MECSNLQKIKNLKLRVISSGCDCNCYRASTDISVKDMLPGDVCPFLLYLMIPYYETLHAGGSFPWMRDLDAVIVQCPSSVGVVAIEVRRRWIKDKVEVYGVINAVKGKCLWGYQNGKQIELEPLRSQNLCLQAYRLLFPHLQALSLINNYRPPVQIQCYVGGGTVFEIK